MSTRETIVADLEAKMAAAIRTAYPWVALGCARDIPGDPKTVDDVSPENTPLVVMDEGSEEYPESENGWTKVKLPIRFRGILRRHNRLVGSMATNANLLLAVMQKAAWGYRHATLSVAVLSDGPSPKYEGPGWAFVDLNIALVYVIKDSDP